MFPFYLGIDLHLKRSYMVLMNAEGEVIDKRRLKNTEMAAYISKNIPKYSYEHNLPNNQTSNRIY